MGFDSEEQLVHAIVACTKHARRSEYRVELEVDAGVGIADIVLTKRTPRSTESLLALGSISPRIAVILNRDIGGPIKSRQALASCLGTSETATRRIINQLSIAGIATHSKESLKISTVRNLPFERLIAIEAKISDWQRVLIQAYRNLQFADESWAVLDHAFIRPAVTNIDRFKASGVGLASVDRERGLFIHYSATTQGPMSIGKRWQAQATLASRVLTRRIASGAL